MEDPFVNLHVHTISSLQDSVIRVEDLVSTVQKYRQNAVAVTDHASCASWVQLNDICQQQIDNPIKPIFGNEFYCWPEGVTKSKDRDHLVLLAMDNDGLVNIRRIQRLAVENSYYKPILKYEFLKELPTNGIYCTSACSLSSISKSILNNNINKAIEYAEFFNDIFDGNFSLELQPHFQYKEQYTINEKLVEISDKLQIPLTVSCDSHFIDGNDQDLRRVLKSIVWKKQYSEVDDSLDSNCVGNSNLVIDFFLKSKFPYMHVVKQAIKQTSNIASLCNAKLEEPKRRIPNFDKYDEFNHLFEEVEW